MLEFGPQMLSADQRNQILQILGSGTHQKAVAGPSKNIGWGNWVVCVSAVLSGGYHASGQWSTTFYLSNEHNFDTSPCIQNCLLYSPREGTQVEESKEQTWRILFWGTAGYGIYEGTHHP